MGEPVEYQGILNEKLQPQEDILHEDLYTSRLKYSSLLLANDGQFHIDPFIVE